MGGGREGGVKIGVVYTALGLGTIIFGYVLVTGHDIGVLYRITKSFPLLPYC